MKKLILISICSLFFVGCDKETHVGYITEYGLGASVENPYIKAVIRNEERYFEVVKEFEPCSKTIGYKKWDRN